MVISDSAVMICPPRSPARRCAASLAGCVARASSGIGRIASNAILYLALNYAISGFALVALRRKEPALARPLRAWGYPVSAVIFIAGAVAFLAGVVIADTSSAVTAFGLLAVGVVAQPVLASRSAAGAERS